MLTMMKSYMESYIKPHIKDEEGQGMVEYGLLVALISIAAIAAIVLIGPKLVTLFTNVANQL